MWTFFKQNNSLGQVITKFKKIRTSPARLGMKAFQSCQGGCQYAWVIRVYEALQDIVYIRLPPWVNFGKLLKSTEITQMGYFWSPLDS